MQYNGRFAPSPTGVLHLGSLFTAFASFLDAKSNNGKWFLRIDNSDKSRICKNSIDTILNTLEKYNLLWDSAIIYQNTRSKIYLDAVNRLKLTNLTYSCNCAKDTLENLSISDSGNRIHSDACIRAKFQGSSSPHSLRLICKNALELYMDLLQGDYQFNVSCEFGDGVLIRSNGCVSYHLANVIDDQLLGITDIVRGYDLISSTPYQNYLQTLLEYSIPRYKHLPILVNSNLQKLSKQTFAPPICTNKVSYNLHYLLQLLQQNPPAVLKKESPQTIVEWGIKHWRIDNLRNLKRIVIPL